MSASATSAESREAGGSRLLRLPFVEAALAVREGRRARRWLVGGAVPLLYVLGTVLVPWLVVPSIYSAVAWWSGQPELRQQPRWMFLTLALTLVGGGMATAFTRVNQLWQAERTRQTLESWLLAPLPTRPLLATASLSGAWPALLLSFPGVLLLVGLAFLLSISLVQTLLTLGLLGLGTVLAGFAATTAFLVSLLGRGNAAGPSPSAGDAPVRAPSLLPLPYALALGAVALMLLGLWLRIETVEHGWGRDGEQHVSRVFLAAGLLTPIPALIGFADRRWWVFRVVERLDFPVPPETAALLLLILYAVAVLVLQRWAERAYERLRDDPELAGSTDRLRAGDQELVAAEAGSYWAGFANPVWTRELRTRLRGKEAPQFIFFASTALAVGGFTPLVSAASRLGDPLETAQIAREVFFWLSMTLAALMVLIAPGLAAEAIHTERARGALELLLTTPMKRSRILKGKLLGDLSVLGLLVSPSLPLLGFCYLFHGASGLQVLGVCTSLAATGLLCSGYGITASALQTRSMASKWQAYLMSLASCGFPGGPLWFIGTLATAHGETALASSGFVWLSPLLMSFYGFLLSVLWTRACDRLETAEL